MRACAVKTWIGAYARKDTDRGAYAARHLRTYVSQASCQRLNADIDSNNRANHPRNREVLESGVTIQCTTLRYVYIARFMPTSLV